MAPIMQIQHQLKSILRESSEPSKTSREVEPVTSLHSVQKRLYDPLPPGHVRLLHLSPATSSAPGLSGWLETRDLSSSKPFVALSWEWGPNENEPPLLSLPAGTVPIRRNAVAALTALQKYHGINSIWIDIVCINQNDLEERSAQVSLMGQLYSKAVEVFIWLGEEDGLSELAFDSAMKIATLEKNKQHRCTEKFDQTRISDGRKLAEEILHKEASAETIPSVTLAKDEDSFPSILERVQIYQSVEIPCNPITQFLAYQKSALQRKEARHMLALLDGLDLSFSISFVRSRLARDILRSPEMLSQPGAPARFADPVLPQNVQHISQQFNARIDLVWRALCSIFGRSWFHRVWMLQEVVLPLQPTVIVGRLALSWDALMHTDTFFWNLGVFNSRNGRASHRAIQMDIERDVFWGKDGRTQLEHTDGTHERIPLNDLLALTRDGDCSEPRDKVFATLGLCHPRHLQALPIDYKMPIDELYIRLARHNIMDMANLDSFQHVSPTLSSDLPSWVSDPRKLSNGTNTFYHLRRNGHDASAGRSLTFRNVTEPANSPRLRLRGRRVMVVGHTSVKLQLIQPNDRQLSRSNQPNTDMKRQLKQYTSVMMVLDIWRALCASKSLDPYPLYTPSVNVSNCSVGIESLLLEDSNDMKPPKKTETLMSAYWRTMCGDIHVGGDGLMMENALDAQYGIVIQQRDAPPWEQLDDFRALFSISAARRMWGGLPRADWGGSPSFWTYAGAMNAHKRFFVTHDGFIGTGPVDLREGDEIWVLEGGIMPFVLRGTDSATTAPYTKTTNTRKLVGPAYVHGIMHGEAWGPGDFGVQDVVLI